MLKASYKTLITGCCLFALSTAISQSVNAQSLFQTPTQQPVFGTQNITTPKADSLIATLSPKAVVNTDKAHAASLIRFDQSFDQFRLEGEDAVATLSFQLDLQRAGTLGELVLSQKNAVSVMPEASRVSVKVNGYPVGHFDVQSPEDFRAHSFTVPANALVNGTNLVQLHAIQRHRVDCSLEATYELWTDIDPHTSGFKPSVKPAFDTIASLKSIPRNSDGLTDLRLVLPNTADISALNAALPLIQTLTLALNRDDIAVSISDKPGMGAGLDIYVSASESERRNDVTITNAPRGLSVRPTSNPERAAVILKAATAGQIKAELLSAMRTNIKPLIDQAVYDDKLGELRVEANQSYTLKDVGYEARVFSGRLFRTSFDLVMPSDFYPAEYATVDVMLNAATSPGLRPESQLLVRVNDKVVKSLPMRDTDGQTFEGRRMELPLRAFKPGRNKIEFLAEVERESDEACVYSERNEATPRFIMLDDTEIVVPRLARIARLPDLSVMSAKAYPYNEDETLNIYAEHTDSRTLSAVMTMASKMSLSAKVPLKTNIVLGRPDVNDAGNKLIISPRGAFTQSLPAGENLSNSARIKFHDIDWLPDFTPTASISSFTPPVQTAADSDDLLAVFRNKARAQDVVISTSGTIKQVFGDAMHSFKSWLRYQPTIDEAPTGSSSARNAQLIQRVDNRDNAIVTWLTAETPQDIYMAANILAKPDVWSEVKGSDVQINLTNGKIQSQMPSSYSIHALPEKTPGNLRRIAAAWFSDHFMIYIVLVLAVMGLFAAWLAKIIPTMGVRTD